MRPKRQAPQEKLLQTICDNATVDIPQAMIDEQVDDFVKSFEQRLQAQGLNLKDYLAYTNSNLADLKNSRQEDAKKTVKTRLVLEAIMKAENINVTKEDVDAEIEKQAGFSGITVDEFKKSVNEQFLNQMVNNLVINKLLNFLKTNNNM